MSDWSLGLPSIMSRLQGFSPESPTDSPPNTVSIASSSSTVSAQGVASYSLADLEYQSSPDTPFCVVSGAPKLDPNNYSLFGLNNESPPDTPFFVVSGASKLESSNYSIFGQADQVNPEPTSSLYFSVSGQTKLIMTPEEPTVGDTVPPK